MSTVNTQVKGKVFSDASSVVVGLAISFSVGKWIFGEEVGLIGAGYDGITRFVLIFISIAVPMFHAVAVVETYTSKDWAASTFAIATGVLSLLVLVVGLNVGSKLQTKKWSTEADALVRTQIESQRQYVRLSQEISSVAAICRRDASPD